MKHQRILLPTMVVLALALRPALGRADVIVFTSRSAWQAAVAGHPTFLEDFEEFKADTQFRTVTVDVGPFTLHQQGSGSFRNFIDVPPLVFPDNNGTAHASMFTNFGTTTVDLTFKTPVVGFGGDFFGAESGELLNIDLIGAGGNVLAAVPVTVDTGFFGFVTNPEQAVDQLTFRSRTNIPGAFGEGFGLDNVAGATVVPEPGTWILFGLGALALCGQAWRRRRPT
jgi:hypothetical protein